MDQRLARSGSDVAELMNNDSAAPRSKRTAGAKTRKKTVKDIFLDDLTFTKDGQGNEVVEFYIAGNKQDSKAKSNATTSLLMGTGGALPPPRACVCTCTV